ncbi:DUF6624 domain-containing protein [Dysgonomonas sp. 25]|uniref:DUF6624 domain-containing protein n=1 Tax=Dysgonomonas sp. 25 TaxID=2302933 RepID=UPI0013D7C4FA|nr:DUF6624 domain-containing protein [Dysgonomonas sp. 25]NDV69637.1 hypothetical protein [Dysgonomonas sp. 25]
MIRYILIFFFSLSPIVLCGQTEGKVALEEKLQEVYKEDQAIRKSLSNISREWAGKPELRQKIDSIVAVIQKKDSEHQLYISTILDTNGWPSDLSSKANTAIFLVIQHAPLDYMKKYSEMVSEQYANGLIEPSLYAIFKDRLLMYSDEKQLYGSQTMNGYVWPIEDPENVNARREKMGLSTMEKYLEMFSKSGVTIVWEKDITVEELRALIKR